MIAVGDINLEIVLLITLRGSVRERRLGLRLAESRLEPSHNEHPPVVTADEFRMAFLGPSRFNLWLAMEGQSDVE